MSNYNQNKKAIENYRKELKAMSKDISKVDEKVLIIAVNKGLASARRGTPVDTGFMRKMWGTTPLKKTRKKGVEKGLYNGADYASFVDKGHRIVNKNGETIGFVKGKDILIRAEKAVRRSLRQEFKKEVERMNRRYGK